MQTRRTIADRNGWMILMRQEKEAKWARQEKVNEAKRKLNILLPPARTEREEERKRKVKQEYPPRAAQNRARKFFHSTKMHEGSN